MVQPSPKPLPLDAFLKLTETKPASEFIEGQVIQKPMPQGKYSTVQHDLGADLNRVLTWEQIPRNELLHCLTHGTQMGWLIDRKEKLGLIYFADHTLAAFEAPDNRIPVPPFAESFSLTIGQLFSRPEE